MNYPSNIMTRKALITQMGFSEAYLMRAFSTPGSPILFDTEGLEKWRLEDCKMQERARTMRTTVA